jgi:hypothetical protein
MEYMIRNIAAHALPAPVDRVFPDAAPADRFQGDLPRQAVGSNPLYYFTRADRDSLTSRGLDYNACFLDEGNRPIVGPRDWDARGILTRKAVARLRKNGWRHSRWLEENTRFGKGSPFRQVSVEGYGHAAEQLARCVLFEKELLAQLDQNLRASSGDPYVQNYLQGVKCGIQQLALFSWSVTGSQPAGRPFQGTGYWPSYFADVMRRILAETARHPRGIYDHGIFTFDTYLCPDPGNVGWNSDTVAFTYDENPTIETVELGGRRISYVAKKVEWVDVGEGKRVQVVKNSVTLEKDIRHVVRFIGMMTHRLAALPERRIGGHIVSGVMSKFREGSGSVLQTGNGPGDERKCWVLLYDHYAPDLESQDEAGIPVALRVENLPREARQARVSVYRLDKEHGSLFAVTESADFAARRQSQDADRHPFPDAKVIDLLKRKSQLPLDEDFARNGETFTVVDRRMDLNLSLESNRVLFVEIDWSAVDGRSP